MLENQRHAQTEGNAKGHGDTKGEQEDSDPMED